MKKKWISVDSVSPGPHLRTHLSSDLQQKLEWIFNIVKEALPEETIQTFTDGFLRDETPANEIRVWERIALTYRSVRDTETMPRKHLLGEIIVVSMAGEEARSKSKSSDFDLLLATFMRSAAN